jgi:hypothetical protein
MAIKLSPIHAKSISPVGWPVRLVASAGVPDLSVIVSAVLKVRRPSGNVATWSLRKTAEVATGSGTVQMDFDHLFGTGDIDAPGRYSAYVEVTTSGGDTYRWGNTMELPVVAAFE